MCSIPSWKLLLSAAVACFLGLAGSGCHHFSGPFQQQTGGQQNYNPYTTSAQGIQSTRHSQGQYQNSSGVQLTQYSEPGRSKNPVINEHGNTPNELPLPGVMPPGPGQLPPPGPMPTELAMVSHPPYTVAAPDILIIQSQPLLPRPPYKIQPLEVLNVAVADPLPGQPIQGKYPVSPDGRVNLGFAYGSVPVSGLSVEQAQDTIRRHLLRSLQDPQVVVSLDQFRGVPPINGQFLVRPDGTIGLGTYGCVYVAGMTLSQLENVIEHHLSQYVQDPEISVDVFAYNSKKYYVITDGGGFGQLVKSFPYTGNETVLDAIDKIGGLPAVSSKKYIWVARPSPCGSECNQILPVDWNAITQGGSTCTNHQIFPGDRIYVKADPLIAADNYLAKVLAPVERMLGITLLGTSTVNSIRNSNNGVGIIAGGF